VQLDETQKSQFQVALKAMVHKAWSQKK